MNNLIDESGNLSIDFLIGFTIFMLAFIWVAAMVSGIMIGLQSSHIDYDAVAYRTGVILVEDPGWPASPPWEFYTDGQKYEISRFGLAITKNTPGILSQDKVNRFFCSSFIYPDDYQTRAIFGDYPYHFNISVTEMGSSYNQSKGDILPDGYGYIRRLVKIKGVSNASIGRRISVRISSTILPFPEILMSPTMNFRFSSTVPNCKRRGRIPHTALIRRGNRSSSI